jgi:hypothetical protein
MMISCSRAGSRVSAKASRPWFRLEEAALTAVCVALGSEVSVLGLTRRVFFEW